MTLVKVGRVQLDRGTLRLRPCRRRAFKMDHDERKSSDFSVCIAGSAISGFSPAPVLSGSL